MSLKRSEIIFVGIAELSVCACVNFRCDFLSCPYTMSVELHIDRSCLIILISRYFVYFRMFSSLMRVLTMMVMMLRVL